MSRYEDNAERQFNARHVQTNLANLTKLTKMSKLQRLFAVFDATKSKMPSKKAKLAPKKPGSRRDFLRGNWRD
jgi:hypothetical protein